MIGGVARKAHFFVFDLPHSDACYVRAYPAATAEAWIDGHVHAFAFFGGVPRSVLYDNDRCLVSRILADGTRRRARLFGGFLSHYLVRDRYGRPGKGNDKGAVEGLVGFARRNFMVPLPRFAGWDAFNRRLEEQCRRRQGDILRGHRETIGERLVRDLEAMAAPPAAPFEACAQAPGRVSSQSLVRYETNDYSVPVAYVFEHEAAVVRRIFDDYVRKDISMRQIVKGLNRDGIRSPTGRAVWSVSTIGRILRNEAYIGRVYYNRTETVPQRRHAGKTRQVQRPRDQWIAIAVPAILDETLFEAAQRVSRDNSRWNPRRAEPGHWLLRGLVKCGHCGVGVSCHKMRGRNGTFHRYYYCHNHDPLKAGGEHLRCPERNIRADELDTFVFEQVRDTLLRPEVLLAGEHAVSARREPVADELLQAQLAKLQRKNDAITAERRRLVDLYQAALIDREELLRRSKEVKDRKQSVEQQCDALIAQRKELAQQNALRERIIGFSATVGATIDHLDFEQRQKLLRLVVEQVLVRGWRVDIKLRIPLDKPPIAPEPTPSSKDGLRSVDREDVDVVGETVEQRPGQALGAEGPGPFVEGEVGGDEGGAPLVALRDQLEQKLGAGLAQRHEAQLVDDQQRAGDHLLLEPQEAALVAGFHQLVHERGGRDEAGGEAPLAGGQSRAPGRHGSCRCRKGPGR